MNGIIRIILIVFAFSFLSAFSLALNESENSKKTVGVILPMSGKFKPVGLKILKGVELASNIFSEEGSQDIEYIIRDYESDETKLPDIIDEMDRMNVVAIMGPMGTLACGTAMKKRIPTFIFSQESLPAKNGSCCFGNFLTIDTQVKTLLKTASESGIRHFAIVVPSSQVGRMFNDSLHKAAPNYGIDVVLSQEYPSETKDFAAVARTFKETARKQKKPASKSRGENQVIYPDALMIPDSAKNASIIAAYLANYGITDLRLFGPASWDTPDLTRLGGKQIEGAYYVSGFYSESSQAIVRDFIADFKNTYDAMPTIWEASSYDTASIIRQLIGRGHDSRDKFAEAVASLKDYKGASGTISFNFDGSTSKDVPVLTIRDGTVVEVVQ